MTVYNHQTFLFSCLENRNCQSADMIWALQLQSVSWSLAGFRHNKIVQSPHENYFNVCRQHKEKCLVKMTIIQTG